MTLKRVWLPSPNYSSRSGATVRLIVLHSSEGAVSYQSLGAYFANPAREASSHVGTDNVTPGVIGEYVSRGNKAWTEVSFNPVSVSAELCTPRGASYTWTRDQWMSRKVMLDNTAAWVAEEAKVFGIPVRALTAAQAQGGSWGVCQHKDLGAAGGNHGDCGPNFPMDYIISKAQSLSYWTFGPVRGLEVLNAGPHSVKIEVMSPSTFVGVPPSPPPGIDHYQVTIVPAGTAASISTYPRTFDKNLSSAVQQWQGGGLTPGTGYEVWVRAALADGSHSSAWAKKHFRTPLR